MPRAKITEEEKKARADELIANAEKFAKMTIADLVNDKTIKAFVKKARARKGTDEEQIFKALIDGFVSGDIEFEERVIFAVKKK